CFKSVGIQDFPVGIVKICRASVGRIVICFDWLARRFEIGARRPKVRFDNLYVAVPPDGFCQLCAFFCSQVDCGVWSPVRGPLRGNILGHQICGHDSAECSCNEDEDHTAYSHSGSPSYRAFTVKYRNGPLTSLNQCGSPCGMMSTSPGLSLCSSPPF